MKNPIVHLILVALAIAWLANTDWFREQNPENPDPMKVPGYSVQMAKAWPFMTDAYYASRGGHR